MTVWNRGTLDEAGEVDEDQIILAFLSLGPPRVQSLPSRRSQASGKDRETIGMQ